MANKLLEEKRRQVEREFDLLQTKFGDLTKAMKDKEKFQQQQDELNLIQAYFNKLMDKKRKEVMDKVVNMVSYGLQTVFRDPTMKLCVDTRLQNNQKFYMLAIEIDGVKSSNWDEVSGGARDILIAMLKVVFLVVSSNRRFLILDEPFRGVSKEYRENLGDFLIYLADTLKVQFLIVSHQVEIDNSADKLYSIKKVEGETQILPV